MSFAEVTPDLIDRTKSLYGNCTNGNATNCTYKETRVAYIADTNNHCIRMLDVETSFVSTVAGVCGTDTAGLRDGPYTVNLLN